MQPYLHKAFFYSKALSYVRFYENAGLLIVGFRTGQALRYTDASVADFHRLARSRAPGKDFRTWLDDRRSRRLPRGIPMTVREVMRSGESCALPIVRVEEAPTEEGPRKAVGT